MIINIEGLAVKFSGRLSRCICSFVIVLRAQFNCVDHA